MVLKREPERTLLDGEYDKVYASCIFEYSAGKLEVARRNWPGLVVGGTGSGSWVKLEDVVPGIPVEYDYELYPGYRSSIGFTQRGCRLKCSFCVVPRKEGAPEREMGVREVWRGEGWPKELMLLDNDFFGCEGWEEEVEEMVEGGFKVCFTQGINVRMITEEAAQALSRVKYRDTSFRVPRLYTAWDNLGHERVFFRGLDRLEEAGVPAKHVLAYMLVGYAEGETWEERWYRFRRMESRGVLPFPMVYNREDTDLRRWQRWIVRGFYRHATWKEYCQYNKYEGLYERAGER